MAERIDSYDFSRSQGRQGSKYDQYMDGGIYRLKVGEDIPSLTARTNLHTVAKKNGKKLRVAAEPGALVIQAYVPEATS